MKKGLIVILMLLMYSAVIAAPDELFGDATARPNNGSGNGSVGVGTGGSNGGALPVPEPGTIILLSTGLLGLIAARKKIGK